MYNSLEYVKLQCITSETKVRRTIYISMRDCSDFKWEIAENAATTNQNSVFRSLEHTIKTAHSILAAHGSFAEASEWQLL